MLLPFLFALTLDSARLDPHVRSSEPDILAALREGIEGSVTFHRLVDALNHSDVVVYVTAGRQASGNVAHLSFLSAAGGRRYLRVSLDPRVSVSVRAALLGHELRHALEIAEDPSVVDERTLAALYHRIGFERGGRAEQSFDTDSAIHAGRQIQWELTDAGVHADGRNFR
jgi:hypothetical protein